MQTANDGGYWLLIYRTYKFVNPTAVIGETEIERVNGIYFEKFSKNPISSVSNCINLNNSRKS